MQYNNTFYYKNTIDFLFLVNCTINETEYWSECSNTRGIGRQVYLGDVCKPFPAERKCWREEDGK